MTPEQVALAFVEAVNAKRLDGLAALMAEHHVFIDSDGSEITGRREMHEAWRNYFSLVPDYTIHVREIFSRDRTVVLAGTAEGTFAGRGSAEAALAGGDALLPDNHWSVPAAWRVVIEGDRVAVWQLYVNPDPMRRIIDRMNTR
ncbi:MAG: nuclear transport factor 2 family protein [Chitinivibrionia bacterium]|nr:nuclear transport factor 2 family protein [Chitinivibrionia bacterium]